MARIFISYRRDDSDIWVSRLVEELCKHFPSDQVFQDVASIDPGADFVESLDKALGTAAVMLAVIGPGWLSATDKQGRRRLDLPGDFVRQEIAESLRRPGVRVFPLLVNGAQMPAEEDLPDPLKALHRRQAFDLTVRHWHPDVAQLVQTLKRVPGLAEDRRENEAEIRERAEQDAQRRDAQERAAREEAERISAQAQARKDAEAQARRKAEDEERRRFEDEAQQKAAQATQRKAAEAESQRDATVAQSAETGHTAGTAWKPLAVIGAVIVVVALLVFFGSNQVETQPAAAPASETKQATPGVAKTESPPSTRRASSLAKPFVTAASAPRWS